MAKWLGDSDLCPHCRVPQNSKEFQDKELERIAFRSDMDRIITDIFARTILTTLLEARPENQSSLRQLQFRVRNPFNETGLFFYYLPKESVIV